MAIVTGALENRTNVTDDGTTLLDGTAFFNSAVGPDGITYLYVRSQTDGGIQTFRLNSEGSLTTLGNVPDDGTVNLDGLGAVQSYSIGGQTYLYANSNSEDGLSVFKVNAGGSLTFVENIDDAGVLELEGAGYPMAISEIDGNAFLTVAGRFDDGFSVFLINNDGTLTNTDNEDNGDNAQSLLDAASDIASLDVGANHYLFVAATNNDALNVFELDGSGNVTLADVVQDGDDPDYNFLNATAVATATVAGTGYVFVGSNLGEGISVFSVANDGTLANVFNLDDNPGLALVDVVALDVHELDGETFLAVPGFNDNGFSLFHVRDDGSLAEAITVFDDPTLELNGAIDAHFQFLNGSPFLQVTGFNDSGISSFEWGAGNDILSGTSADDVLMGFRGKDTLNGANGDDRLNGGAGNDILIGGGGDDLIIDGSAGDTAGSDTVNAGSGDDVVVVGKIGGGTYDGGTGNDAIVLAGNANAFTGNNTIDLSQTTMTLYGVNFSNFESGGGGMGDDIVLGTSGQNTLYGSAGDDMMDGGNGTDTVNYSYLEAGVTIRLDRDDQTATSDVGNDALTSIENATGSNFDDTIYGDNGFNVLSGLSGDDRIYGQSGADVILGGNGEDKLYGRGGDDNLNGGDGADLLLGDAGADIIIGSTGNDRIYAGSGNDEVLGGAGLDLLDGSGGMDTYNGGAGNDRLYTRSDGVMDTFIYDVGTGSDRIFRYEEDIDRIQISSSFGYTSGQDVIDNAISASMSADVSGTVTITLNGAGDTIQIINYGLLNPGADLQDLADDIVIV